MIFFVEPNKTRAEHLMLNASLIDIIALTFPGETLDAYVSDSQKANIQKLHQKEKVNVSFNKITVVSPMQANKFSWVLKFVNELRLITYIFLKSIVRKPRLVFFSSLSPIGNYAASLYSKVFSQTRVLVTLHGELELIKIDKAKKKIDIILGKILKRALKIKAGNRKYLVLSDFIRSNLAKYDVVADSQVLSIEHPYSFENSTPVDRDLTMPLIIGHLGVAKLEKSSQDFFRLAEYFKDEIRKGLVRFQIAGIVLKEVDIYTNDFVEYEKANELLSKEKYEALCKGIDYAVLLYKNDYYELTSSGAIMDALLYAKPILTYRDNCFSGLFSDQYRPGRMFEDLDSLKEGIEKLIYTDAHARTVDYKRMADDLIAVRKYFDVNMIQAQFKVQLFGHWTF